MARKPPRYRLVTDAADSHRGIPLAAAEHTYGSSQPYAAAVLCAKRYCADPAACQCGATCTCPQVKRWVVSRTCFSRLAAETHCDALRGRGQTALVVPMIPVDPPIRRSAAEESAQISDDRRLAHGLPTNSVRFRR
jgi:hypothetical protein